MRWSLPPNRSWTGLSQVSLTGLTHPRRQRAGRASPARLPIATGLFGRYPGRYPSDPEPMGPRGGRAGMYTRRNCMESSTQHWMVFVGSVVAYFLALKDADAV